MDYPLGINEPTQTITSSVSSTNYYHVVEPFKSKLKNAFESGLLLFAKYALVLFLSYIALQFLTSIISGSQNGTNAVLYLNELQNKGYLPKVVNGQVPPLEKKE